MSVTKPLSFVQPGPELDNEYRDDWLLRAWLESALPADVLAEHEPVFDELGRRSGGEWHRYQCADRLNEPRLTQWSPWGERIDEIELTPLWRDARH